MRSRIGRACALGLAAAGHDVAINWLDDRAAAEAVAEAVRAAGRQAVLVQGMSAPGPPPAPRWCRRRSRTSGGSTCW
ncbi:hypothetical protein ACFQY5_00715 [Paeniroseomonas aquatica]|uniref:hypothetical protein n=1 Tax=Paeniroseomonas aquatica TaxID=373043 RepID=UPI00361E40BF